MKTDYTSPEDVLRPNPKTHMSMHLNAPRAGTESAQTKSDQVVRALDALGYRIARLEGLVGRIVGEENDRDRREAVGREGPAIAYLLSAVPQELAVLEDRLMVAIEKLETALF